MIRRRGACGHTPRCLWSDTCRVGGARTGTPNPSPPNKNNGAQTRTGHMEGCEPHGKALLEPYKGTSRSARGGKRGEGPERRRRESERAPMHKGHAANRKGHWTEAAQCADHMEWCTSVQGKEKLGRVNRHSPRARRLRHRKKGRGRATRHRPHPRPAVRTASTRAGYCTRQRNSGAPTPRTSPVARQPPR